MRFAISIPQYARDSRFDDNAFRAHLRRIEELALFEGVWTQEQVIGAAGSIAPLQALTYAAACTERLRLGCAVFVLPLHNPLHLAKAISSLDCLSHGRVDIGVATGGRGRPFEAFGVDEDRPVARFNEALALMKACWTEPEINLMAGCGSSMAPRWSPSRCRRRTRRSGSVGVCRRACGAPSGTETGSWARGPRRRLSSPNRSRC